MAWFTRHYDSQRPAARTWLIAIALLLVHGDPALADRHIFVGLQRNGVAGVTGLFGVRGIGISPDGAHVYAGSGGQGHGIVTFGRGPTTGGVAFVEQLLANASQSVVSPDGVHVYATASSSVEVYERDAVTGKLTKVEDEPAVADGIDISPDGQHVYVAGGDFLQVYGRNAGTGELTFIEQHEDGVSGVDGLGHGVDVSVSPDGGYVYVAGQNDDALAVFSRNAGTGELTFVEVQQDGVGGVEGLDKVSGVRVSPDGNHVYASGVDLTTPSGGGLAIFSRNTTTGALTFMMYTAGGVLSGFGRVAISPDGSQVYLLKRGQSRLAVFARDSVSGALMFEEDLVDDMGGVDGLGTPEDVVVSPDNRHVYVAASEGTVAAFERINVTCSDTPLGGCFAPTLSEKALLVVKDNAIDQKDKLVWKWLKGEAVSVGDYGDPAATANDYALCIYDGTANPQPIAELLAPAGGGCGKKADGGGVPCWKAISTKGFSYKRKDTHPDGVVAAKLLAGEAGRPKIVVKAKKDFTPTPAVPLTLPVTVQLQNANGGCWTATYATALVNESGLFKAKAE